MALACNCVLNSEQLGGAVLLTRSKRLLQSVAARSPPLIVEYDGGKCLRVSEGRLQSHVSSRIHAQHKRVQERWSNAVLNEAVSVLACW